MKGVAATMLEAVRAMNTKPDLAFTWPSYLRSLSDDILPQTFLSPLAEKKGHIHKILRSSPILFAWDGKLKKPSEVLFLPAKYLDRSRSPLLDHFDDLALLSSQYESTCYPILQWLGVTELKDDVFLRKLGQLSHAALKRKSENWHEDLARCLNPMVDGHLTELRSVPLIPLRDESWVSAKDVKSNAVYYDGRERPNPAPNGTALRLINKRASENPHRKDLFAKLGALIYPIKKACAAIIDFHKAVEKPQLSCNDLLYHMWFLFEYRDTYKNVKNLRHLWLFDTQGSSSRGSDLYVDNPASSFRISKALNDDNGQFPFISPRYFSYSRVLNNQRKTYATWLLQPSIGLCTIPRLVAKNKVGIRRSRTDPSRWEVSLAADFKQVIATNPSHYFLRILIENWDYYYTKAEFKIDAEENRDVILTALKEQDVATKMGERPLHTTFLLSSTLGKTEDLQAMNLPWLELDLSSINVKPEKIRGILPHLGVTVSPSASFYLAILIDLRSQPSTSMTAVHRVYNKFSKYLASKDTGEDGLVK